MDYSHPSLADRLAAEYVLGTLRGPARRRFETLLPAHPALQQAVQQWQTRLAPLSLTAAPVQPDPAVWQAVQQRLFENPAERGVTPSAGLAKPAVISAATSTWWQRLQFWQGLSGLALAAVLGLSLLLTQSQTAQPPVVVVLAANPGSGASAEMQNASFVLSLSADGRSLVLRPINAPALATTRAFELWAVPASGAPRSLGLVSGQDGATIRRSGLLQGTAAFAVSVEPAGGSPTGAPTGPIVSLGRLPS